jgi:hypothetical protein
VLSSAIPILLVVVVEPFCYLILLCILRVILIFSFSLFVDNLDPNCPLRSWKILCWNIRGINLDKWKVLKSKINVSVFSAPVNYEVVKITHSNSKVVLRTINHTIIYPGSAPSSEVIALHPVA